MEVLVYKYTLHQCLDFRVKCRKSLDVFFGGICCIKRGGTSLKCQGALLKCEKKVCSNGKKCVKIYNCCNPVEFLAGYPFNILLLF